MLCTRPISAIAFAFALVSTVSAEPIFLDSFESADMSTTNNDGFTWGANNATSIVTSDELVYDNGEKSIPVPSGRDWTPKEGAGEHHLRFRFGPGRFMSEQRFKLGQHYPDLWISYWVKVPDNFIQGSLNSKFLSLWPDTYDREGTVTWNTRPNGMGGARIVVSDGGVTRAESLSTPFISVPNDRGRWMHIIARVKSASGPDVNDGIIQLYRRWQDETQYTLLHNKTNADTWDNTSSTQGISQGYIFGWANDPYDENTEWFIDEFATHTSRPELLDEQRAAPEPPKLEVR